MKIRWSVVCLLVFVFALVLGSPQAAFARNVKKVDMPPEFEGDPGGGWYGMDGSGGGGISSPSIPSRNEKDVKGGLSELKMTYPVSTVHLVVGSPVPVCVVFRVFATDHIFLDCFTPGTHR